MEEMAKTEGKDFAGLSLEEKEGYWVKAKKEEGFRG
jgi:hypothetical protein